MLRILALAALAAAPAAAQVSLDQADQVMSALDTEMEAFRTRLNDPDPDKALAILQLLIVEGDANQRRLATRHGLQSTDRAIRATTLRAILDSDPTLTMAFDPVAEEPDGYFARDVANAGGVIDEEGVATVQRKITGFDEGEDCWTVHPNACFARMRGDVVSLLFGGTWGAYELNGSGQLVGQQQITGNLAEGSIDLSE